MDEVVAPVIDHCGDRACGACGQDAAGRTELDLPAGAFVDGDLQIAGQQRCRLFVRPHGGPEARLAGELQFGFARRVSLVMDDSDSDDPGSNRAEGCRQKRSVEGIAPIADDSGGGVYNQSSGVGIDLDIADLCCPQGGEPRGQQPVAIGELHARRSLTSPRRRRRRGPGCAGRSGRRPTSGPMRSAPRHSAWVRRASGRPARKRARSVPSASRDW